MKIISALLFGFTVFFLQTPVFSAVEDNLPPGWDQGGKGGWDSEIPPGLDRSGFDDDGNDRTKNFEDRGGFGDTTDIPFTPPTEDPSPTPIPDPIEDPVTPLPPPPHDTPFPEIGSDPSPSHNDSSRAVQENSDSNTELIETTYQTYIPAEEVSEATATWGNTSEKIKGSASKSSFLFMVTGKVSSVNKKKNYIVIHDKAKHRDRTIYVRPAMARSLREGSIVQTWLRPGSDTAERIQQIR